MCTIGALTDYNNSDNKVWTKSDIIQQSSTSEPDVKSRDPLRRWTLTKTEKRKHSSSYRCVLSVIPVLAIVASSANLDNRIRGIS